MSIIARSTKMKVLWVRCECPNKTERTETTWGTVWRSRVTALMWRGAEDRCTSQRKPRRYYTDADVTVRADSGQLMWVMSHMGQGSNRSLVKRVRGYVGHVSNRSWVKRVISHVGQGSNESYGSRVTLIMSHWPAVVRYVDGLVVVTSVISQMFIVYM